MSTVVVPVQSEATSESHPVKGLLLKPPALIVILSQAVGSAESELVKYLQITLVNITGAIGLFGLSEDVLSLRC